MGLVADLRRWYESNPEDNEETTRLIFAVLKTRTADELMQIDEDPQNFLQNIIEFLGKMYANKDNEGNDDQLIEPKIDA